VFGKTIGVCAWAADASASPRQAIRLDNVFRPKPCIPIERLISRDPVMKLRRKLNLDRKEAASNANQITMGGTSFLKKSDVLGPIPANFAGRSDLRPVRQATRRSRSLEVLLNLCVYSVEQYRE